MKLTGWVIGLCLAVAPVVALAEAPTTSLRPVPRAAINAIVDDVVVDVIVSQVAPLRSLRPAARPGTQTTPAPAATARRDVVEDAVNAALRSVSVVSPASAATAPTFTALAVARSLRPAPRPRDLTTRVVAAPRATSRRGSVCGVAEIKGEAIAPVNGRGACGIDAPVRVTSVSGVSLRQAPTIDCQTAKALNTWVRTGVIPAVGRTGGGLAQINVVAHYACRTRNHKSGARLSEHSFGHAVDVSGVTLRDGTRLTVLDHWRSGRYGKIIKAMHASACGPFGTVLGPNSDRYHKDHLHIDTARYRSGPYCR